ncbi:polysaccharide deacetylase family protein [Cohnella kolymensis]|uniref:polysaccharide deacetylase family protein n=1 Tax=Cohnella kolymensis TaxID=1590652 RepID=UPI000697B43B|nr:polysaccharide deacetylase family protein [Cohnella kolymensis]
MRAAAALLILFIPSGCLSPSSVEVQPTEASHPPPAVSSPPAATPTQAPVQTNEPIPSTPIPSQPPPVQLVQYERPVEHIFFHPLIAFPELAFDGDSLSEGYDNWFVTVPEFLAMLDELYKRNYMLIDIHSLYRVEVKDGRSVVQKESLTLPVGKKPLILSVDDVNYYDYMRKNGNIWRLVADEDGTVTAWSRTPDGEEKTSRAWDLVPIVDDFVKEHPDFSWQGAKGLLALTGYEGVLGYRTNNPDDASYDNEKREAEQIVKKLKESGWTFASHSWGHLDVNKSSLSRLKRDTARWKKEVEPLVGPTDIFVYPFGSSVKYDDPKFQYLQAQGFALFCSVGPSPYIAFRQNAAVMDRRHIDGMALRTQRKGLAPLFGDRPILDPLRPQK